jgi:urease accessory protein
MTSLQTTQSLQDEIIKLEERLQEAKTKLSSIIQSSPTNGIPAHAKPTSETPYLPNTSLHTLVLLADSALPLGSFAFSSGLESFLAHRRLANPQTSGVKTAQPVLLDHFLRLSLQSLASTALPYVLAAHRTPQRIVQLDNDFDASTPCVVARRASVAQGRALLAVWERSFGQLSSQHGHAGESSDEAVTALQGYASHLRLHGTHTFAPNAHFPPLWGIVSRVLDVPLAAAAYLFLFSHVRAVVSAAVRANVLGPYQAQGELARVDLRERIESLVQEFWETGTEEAGQTVPAMDFWVGRHEKLYSRIFNS